MHFNICMKTNVRENEKACLENTFCFTLVSMPLLLQVFGIGDACIGMCNEVRG